MRIRGLERLRQTFARRLDQKLTKAAEAALRDHRMHFFAKKDGLVHCTRCPIDIKPRFITFYLGKCCKYPNVDVIPPWASSPKLRALAAKLRYHNASAQMSNSKTAHGRVRC